MAPDCNALVEIIKLTTYYLKRDLNPDSFTSGEAASKSNKNKASKYEEFTTGNLEDALTKVMKLIANLATEEESSISSLQLVKSSDVLSDFFSALMSAVSTR